MTDPTSAPRRGLVAFLTSTPVLVIVALISVGVLISRRLPQSPEERIAALEAQALQFQQRFDEWDAALNAGDVDAAMTVLGSAPALMPPGEPEVFGQPDVRAWLERLFARGQIRAEHRIGTVQGKQDFFVANGDYTLSIQGPDGGSPITDRGKWVAVLFRDPDSSLALVRFIWNLDGPTPDEAK